MMMIKEKGKIQAEAILLRNIRGKKII